MKKPSPLKTIEPARLQAPVARILRPLVRLFIRSGITFPALSNLLRELYVNVAEYDFALPGKDQTDSRVSLLTGIHRKEVARLRGAGAPISAVPGAVSRTSRIMARWLSAAAFTDGRGQPAPLARGIAEGGGASFEALVSSVTKDVRPRAVLDEWLDRGLVTIDESDKVVLNEAAFIPAGGSDQQLYYFGRNLHDHVAAAVENVLSDGPRFLERAVHYDGLSEGLAKQLEDRSKLLAMDAFKAANKDANDACETDAGGNWRWNFGVYVYREEMTPDPTEGSKDVSTPKKPRAPK